MRRFSALEAKSLGLVSRVFGSKEVMYEEVRVVAKDIPVQNPAKEDFSSTDLEWTKYGTDEHHGDVALIPYERVDSFIMGECLYLECPTRFHIERGRRRKKRSLKTYNSDEYLEDRVYWCSFGPENYGEGSTILYSRRYRLNTLTKLTTIVQSVKTTESPRQALGRWCLGPLDSCFTHNGISSYWSDVRSMKSKPQRLFE